MAFFQVTQLCLSNRADMDLYTNFPQVVYECSSCLLSPEE